LSALPGQFLLKDLVLMGAALWTLGESMGARRSRPRVGESVLVGSTPGEMVHQNHAD